MTELTQWQRLLLDLISPRRNVDPARISALGAEDWNRLLAIFPVPTDLLLHLIIHAVLDHKLTNGPLILSDLAFLLERQPIDWPSFWQAAGQCPIRRACWLILRLVEVEWGSENIGWPEASLAFTGADQALDQAACSCCAIWALKMIWVCACAGAVRTELDQINDLERWLAG